MSKYIKIKTGFIRLDQLLKFSGIAESGGHAKDIIMDGEVTVNGQVCLQRGKKIYPGDEILLEGYDIVVE